MSGRSTPDPARLAAARGVAKGLVDRKRLWTKGLFIVGCVAEATLFGAMLFFFDFSDRLYWFIFWGLSFVYSPLLVFIWRNSIMVGRLHLRLLLELKLDPEIAEAHSFTDDSTARDEARTFLASKDRWVKWLYVLAGAFECGLFFAMLWFMDFSSQLDWFLSIGFMAVYTPLIIFTWRNAFAIDRVYYSLIDDLKYEAYSSVKGGSAGEH